MYLSKKRKRIKVLSSDQKALVIFDTFKGQVVNEVLESCILVTTVTANMTKYYQPLDLMVNEYAKKFLAKHFNEWNTAQISKQFKNGKALDEVDVKVRFSVVKHLDT